MSRKTKKSPKRSAVQVAMTTKRGAHYRGTEQNGFYSLRVTTVYGDDVIFYRGKRGGYYIDGRDDEKMDEDSIFSELKRLLDTELEAHYALIDLVG